jgi:hypothetical protein
MSLGRGYDSIARVVTRHPHLRSGRAVLGQPTNSSRAFSPGSFTTCTTSSARGRPDRSKGGGKMPGILSQNSRTVSPVSERRLRHLVLPDGQSTAETANLAETKMTSSAPHASRRNRILTTGAILGLAAIGIAAAPKPANTWWHGYGWGLGRDL